MTAVAILGAGSIGCFVGGLLAHGGHSVSLLARPRIVAEIAAHGLRLTSLDGLDVTVPPDRLVLSDRADILARAQIICVTVKSHDTADAAALVAHNAPPQAIVVSLQNGIGNVPMLRAQLPARSVLGGMVPFNVIAQGEGWFHRATSGEIVLEKHSRDVARELAVEGLPMRTSDDIVGVQWGKLLLNLNNALNALSGLPLRAQVSNREWRRVMADQWAEALRVLRAAGIAAISATPLPLALTPLALRLPDGLFRLLLGRTMKIDANARSSMADDLQRGRRTEIDFLQGEIVALAAQHGVAAPLATRIVALIKQAEAAGRGPPQLMPQQIRGVGLPEPAK